MKKLIALTALTLMLPAMAFAASDTYRTGSMSFSFKAGTSVPGFIYFFGEAEGLENRFGWGEGDKTTELHWGGDFQLGFERFTNDRLSLGGSLGYNFNYCVNDNLLSEVPLQFNVSYYPVQGKVDIPITLGVGLTYERFGEDKSMLNPSISLTTGMDFYIWDDWGLGFRTGLWLVPEFNFINNEQDNDGVFGMFPIMLSITYRHL